MSIEEKAKERGQWASDGAVSRGAVDGGAAAAAEKRRIETRIGTILF